MRQFVCAGCGYSYNTETPKEIMELEMVEMYGEVLPDDETASTCDSCYDKMKEYYANGNNRGNR